MNNLTKFFLWLNFFHLGLAQNYNWSWISDVYEDPCPSVYVYDTGPQYYGKEGFNYQKYITSGIENHFGKTCGNFPGVYQTEQTELLRIVLFRLYKSKRCQLVTDPNKAKIFLVPMYPGKMSSLDWINSCKANKNNPLPHLPYLSKETAPFHFFIISKSPMSGCEGWFRYPKNDSLIKEAVRFAYGTVYIGRNTSGTSEYKPAAPYEGSLAQQNLLEDHEYGPNSLSIPYPSSIHWSHVYSKGMKAPWQSEGSKRHYLVSFTGSFRDCSFGHIRPYLEKAFHNCPEDVCISIHGGQCEFIRTKLNSVFCLEPGGDSPWRKSFYDSITSGCIPVIFSPYNMLVSPWHWGPIVHNASVFIDGNKIASGEIDLIKYLQAIPKQQRKDMQRTISTYGHMIQYGLDDYPNDGVEIMLKGVYRYGMMRLNKSIHTNI